MHRDSSPVTRPTRLLLVEDADEDALYVRAMLANVGRYEVTWVTSHDAAIAALADGQHDVCLLDYHLGDRTGLEVLRAVDRDHSIPIIMLTGKGGHEIDVETMEAGAADYIEKGGLQPASLERSIRFALERARMTEELRESQRFLQSTLDALSAHIAILDDQGRIIATNAAWRRSTTEGQLFGLRHAVGASYLEACEGAEGEDANAAHELAQAIRAVMTPGGEPGYIEYPCHSPGRKAWYAARITRFDPLEPVRVVVAHQDISQRKLAEQRLERTLTRIEESHDDLLSILGRLRSGTLMTDRRGHVTFVSPAAARLIGRTPESVAGQPWDVVCGFRSEDVGRIRAMAELPLEERRKVPVCREAVGEHAYWMDVEVQDDPRDPRRQIFFFYDVTEVHDLRRLLAGQAKFQNLVGKSAPMKVVYAQIEQLARVDSTALIEGETGTGKELVARAIHDTSERKAGPFIALNCAGLTDSLLSSQLFGHKRGAFTGAIADHRGLFESAQDGTLFLDEIGDVPASVQASLLRVIQEREVVRVGESVPRKINVRILAATNRDLQTEVDKGSFRMDLLYRIRVARIVLPPLRQRREDIPLLVASFLAKFRAALGKQVEDVSIDAIRLLMRHDWPGNVRELEGAIEYAVVRCDGAYLRSEDLPPEILTSRDGDDERPAAGIRRSFEDESERVRDALDRARGNRTVAAKLLGVSRATLYRRLSELNLTGV